jgi:hypothetical protein
MRCGAVPWWWYCVLGCIGTFHSLEWLVPSSRQSWFCRVVGPQPCFVCFVSLRFGINCTDIIPIPVIVDLLPSHYLHPSGQSMVQPRFSRQLSRCLRFSQSQSRAIHCSPRRCSPTPLSIASLLDSAPAETENVTVNGFIRSIRNQKQRSFAAIGDGSSLEPLQALLTPEQAQKSGPATNCFSLLISPQFINWYCGAIDGSMETVLQSESAEP